MASCLMALTFELSEPTALAAGCSLVELSEAAGCILVNFSINSGPKLTLTVHKVSAIWHPAGASKTNGKESQ